MNDVNKPKKITRNKKTLSKPSVKVECDDDIQDIISGMIHSMDASSTPCVALSANQIGIHKRACVIMIGGKYCEFINPLIIGNGGKLITSSESCLSVDGVTSSRRYSTVMVAYRDMSYNKRYCRLTGKDAIIMQHMIDHFAGKLI